MGDTIVQERLEHGMQRVEARVRRETEFLLEQAAQFPLLVVTHAGFLRVALACRYGRATKETLETTPDYAAVISTDGQALALSMGLCRQR